MSASVRRTAPAAMRGVPPTRPRVRQRRQQRAFLGARHAHRQRQRHVWEAQQQQQLRRGLGCALHRPARAATAQLRHLRRRQRPCSAGGARKHSRGEPSPAAEHRRRAERRGAPPPRRRRRRRAPPPGSPRRRPHHAAQRFIRSGPPSPPGFRTREGRQKLDGAAAGAARTDDVADLQLAEAVVPTPPPPRPTRRASRQLRERRLGRRREGADAGCSPSSTTSQRLTPARRRSDTRQPPLRARAGGPSRRRRPSTRARRAASRGRHRRRSRPRWPRQFLDWVVAPGSIQSDSDTPGGGGTAARRM